MDLYHVRIRLIAKFSITNHGKCESLGTQHLLLLLNALHLIFFISALKYAWPEGDLE